MKIEKASINDVKILIPHVFGDERGFFFESYSQKDFLYNDLKYDFVQDNHSFTQKKNTFRGLHYQLDPKAQTTLVRVLTGKILDIAVDIRKGSPSYGQTSTQILSDKNYKQMLIPKGFAHGFLTLTDNVNILYKMDEVYAPELDRILNYNDPILKLNIKEEISLIAKKDENAPLLKDIENNFVFGVNS